MLYWDSQNWGTNWQLTQMKQPTQHIAQWQCTETMQINYLRIARIYQIL